MECQKHISSPEDLILNRFIVLSAKQWFTAYCHIF